MLSYKIVAPLIIPRMEKDAGLIPGKQTFEEFFLTYDKKEKTASAVIRYTEDDEIKEKEFSRSVDISKKFNKFPGSLIKNKIEKEMPEAEWIFVELSTASRLLVISYLKKEGEQFVTLKSNKYP